VIDGKVFLLKEWKNKASIPSLNTKHLRNDQRNNIQITRSFNLISIVFVAKKAISHETIDIKKWNLKENGVQIQNKFNKQCKRWERWCKL
jgi:hypothetical protein